MEEIQALLRLIWIQMGVFQMCIRIMWGALKVFNVWGGLPRPAKSASLGEGLRQLVCSTFLGRTPPDMLTTAAPGPATQS